MRKQVQSCATKKRYESKEMAAAEIRRLGWSATVKAYRCPFCDRWHIGHRAESFRRGPHGHGRAR